MPVLLEARGLDGDHKAIDASPPGDCLEIGLLNNMGDSGLASGERQFISLLEAAAQDVVVRLKLFSLPQIRRSQATRERIRGLYSSMSSLLSGSLDGLIVTGAEPSAADLPDETFWRSLTEVMDWAEQHTTSTIWSCLAAHAAVLHFDGIPRQPLATKQSGIYAFTRTGDHALLAGTGGGGAPYHAPHSRLNGLDPSLLECHGYQILTRSPVAGVDTFVKKWGSLFVYLQGHPEYDAPALTREYRRDILRFLNEESNRYPTIPENYFRDDVESRMRDFEMRARLDRRPETMFSFPVSIMGDGIKTDRWRQDATVLIHNWLQYLRAQKA
jgi:homoserine O-succinyltransferase